MERWERREMRMRKVKAVKTKVALHLATCYPALFVAVAVCLHLKIKQAAITPSPFGWVLCSPERPVGPHLSIRY